MDDLITWLCGVWDARERQLDDDEHVAQASDPGPWEVGPTFGARDTRVYVREAGNPGIDTIGTCVIAGQVANKTRFRENARHIARWDPQRVLDEIATERRDLDTKRRILEWLDRAERIADAAEVYGIDIDEARRLLALSYADRPGYRNEWRP